MDAFSNFLRALMKIEEIEGRPMSVTLDGGDPFFSPWRHGLNPIKFTWRNNASEKIVELLKERIPREGRIFENVEELKKAIQLSEDSDYNIDYDLVNKTVYTLSGASISICRPFGDLEFLSRTA